MINFRGEFKGFGVEGNIEVEASGDSEAIIPGYLFGVAVLCVGVAIGYGMASAKQWLPKATP